MKGSNDFRIINEFEKKLITSSLKNSYYISKTFIEKIQKRLFISFDRDLSKNEYPSIYILSSDLPNFIEKFDNYIQINSAGLYFGFIKKNQFLLSIEGAEFLLNKSFSFKNQVLQINNDGEKSVLYGNNIQLEMVIRLPSNLRKGDFLVISNVQNEMIAIAKLLVTKQDLMILNPRDKIALNLMDKGYYLRKN